MSVFLSFHHLFSIKLRLFLNLYGKIAFVLSTASFCIFLFISRFILYNRVSAGRSTSMICPAKNLAEHSLANVVAHQISWKLWVRSGVSCVCALLELSVPSDKGLAVSQTKFHSTNPSVGGYYYIF